MNVQVLSIFLFCIWNLKTRQKLSDMKNLQFFVKSFCFSDQNTHLFDG